jgi:hypothetical protein
VTGEGSPQKAPLDLEAQSKGATGGFRILAARTAPWLFDVGGWVFGGLLALTLVLVSALVTVGPVDDAILVSIAAFGCALPLEVAGICLVRLVKDVRDVGIDDLTLQSFKDAGFPDIETYFPPAAEREAQRAKRSAVVLRYSLAIAVATIALTAIGLVAALWYMAWWVGVAAMAVSLLSAALVVTAIVRSQGAASPAEEELRRRYAESRNPRKA